MKQKFRVDDEVRIKRSDQIGKVVEVDQWWGYGYEKQTRCVYWVSVKGYITQVRLFSYQLEKA